MRIHQIDPTPEQEIKNRENDYQNTGEQEEVDGVTSVGIVCFLLLWGTIECNRNGEGGTQSHESEPEPTRAECFIPNGAHRQRQES